MVASMASKNFRSRSFSPGWPALHLPSGKVSLRVHLARRVQSLRIHNDGPWPERLQVHDLRRGLHGSSVPVKRKHQRDRLDVGGRYGAGAKTRACRCTPSTVQVMVVCAKAEGAAAASIARNNRVLKPRVIFAFSLHVVLLAPHAYHAGLIVIGFLLFSHLLFSACIGLLIPQQMRDSMNALFLRLALIATIFIAPLCSAALIQATQPVSAQPDARRSPAPCVNWWKRPPSPDMSRLSARRLSRGMKGMPQKYQAKTDNLGNITVTLGSGSPNRLIVAPMDEPGYVVSGITPEGYLTMQRLPQGGNLPLFNELYAAQPVKMHTSKGAWIYGAVAGVSIHLQPQRQHPPSPADLDNMFVDVGATSRQRGPCRRRRRAQSSGD